MTGDPIRDLRRLPVRRAPALRPQRQYRFDVAAQVVAHGNQETRIRAVTPAASTIGRGSIAVRVGRLLVYLEDRDALRAFVEAFERVGELADAAFGSAGPAPYRLHR